MPVSKLKISTTGNSQRRFPFGTSLEFEYLLCHWFRARRFNLAGSVVDGMPINHYPSYPFFILS